MSIFLRCYVIRCDSNFEKKIIKIGHGNILKKSNKCHEIVGIKWVPIPCFTNKLYKSLTFLEVCDTYNTSF